MSNVNSVFSNAHMIYLETTTEEESSFHSVSRMIETLCWESADPPIADVVQKAKELPANRWEAVQLALITSLQKSSTSPSANQALCDAILSFPGNVGAHVLTALAFHLSCSTDCEALLNDVTAKLAEHNTAIGTSSLNPG